MGRIVYAPFDGISVTTDADQDIFEILAASTAKIILHEFQLTSAAETAEALNLTLRRATGAGSGGSGVTEVLRDEDASAITGSMTTLNTTPGTAGAVLENYQWEQLGPLHRLWTPETRPIINMSGRIALNLATALGSATAMSGFVIWEEV